VKTFPAREDLTGRAFRGGAAWRGVLLLSLTASVGYVCRVDVTVVAPYLRAEFHLTDVQIGEVFSAFLIGYTLFQIPSGWVADRLRTRTLFLGLVSGWAVLTGALIGLGRTPVGWTVGTFGVLLALRFAHGVFASPTYPASARAVAMSIPLSAQGRANGLVLASVGIGSAVTPPLLGFVAGRCGWRPAGLVTSAIAALNAILWWVSKAREQASARSDTALSNRESPPAPALFRRSFWMLTASYTLQGYVGYVFVFWFYLYLVEVRHFTLLTAAWLTTLPWITTLVAVPIGGILSDWAVARWGATWGRRLLPLAALLVAAGALVLGAHTANAAGAVLALTVSTALVLSTEGPYWATLNQLSGSRSGVGGGVMNFGSNVGGTISPLAMPWLAAHFGWESALLLTALVAVASGLLWMGIEISPLPPERMNAGIPL